MNAIGSWYECSPSPHLHTLARHLITSVPPPNPLTLTSSPTVSQPTPTIPTTSLSPSIPWNARPCSPSHQAPSPSIPQPRQLSIPRQFHYTRRVIDQSIKLDNASSRCRHLFGTAPPFSLGFAGDSFGLLVWPVLVCSDLLCIHQSRKLNVHAMW